MWFFTSHHFWQYQVTKCFEKTRTNQPILWHDSLCFYQNKTWPWLFPPSLPIQDMKWLLCVVMMTCPREADCFLVSITLFHHTLGTSFVWVIHSCLGNRFRSQVHDNKVGGSRKKSMFHPYGLLQLTVQPIPLGIGSQMVGMKRDFVLMWLLLGSPFT